MGITSPPACVACFPTALRLRGLPTSLQLLCGVYVVAREMRNGRPAWIRHSPAGRAGGLLASIYWAPERGVWTLWVSGSSGIAQAVSLAVQSKHEHSTPIGEWSQGASVLVELGDGGFLS